jgi:hypothetical protein
MTGVQNRPKLIIATVLTTLALLLAGHSILQLDAPSELASRDAAKVTSKQTADAESPRKRTAENRGAFDPTLNSAQLLAAEGKLYEGTGRNIFSTSVESRATQNPPQRRPSPPDRTPTIAKPEFVLKFFGFATTANSPRTIFLSIGNDIFVGAEGDIVDRRYRIVRIAPEFVDVKDLLDDSPHAIAIQQG